MLGFPNNLDKIMKTLAERLKYAMETLPPKKIKGVELARVVGVKPPSVSDWLSGKSKTMEGENLLKTAKYLNINPVWLATGKGEISSDITTNQSELVNNSDSITALRNPALEKIIIQLEKLDQENKLSPQVLNIIESAIKMANSIPMNKK